MNTQLLREIISEAPRQGIELLLVNTGVKQGDVIDWLIQTNKPLTKKMIKYIREESVMDGFRVVKNEFPQIYYYNIEKTNKRLLTMINITGQYHGSIARVIEGLFFSYPICCIMAHERRTSHPELMAFTEHYWCSPDCKSSKRMQARYKKAIQDNLPELRINQSLMELTPQTL